MHFLWSLQVRDAVGGPALRPAPYIECCGPLLGFEFGKVKDRNRWIAAISRPTSNARNGSTVQFTD